MPTIVKSQRIRDPVHNLIEFRTDQLERTLWKVIQTQPFQRLRRIRQLGFSEFVFPGATHTRFAHSVGVFHMARQLIKIIKHYTAGNSQPHQCDVALAAALVHDVGHGMFSHAFEEISNELSLPLARHEKVSEALIRDGEIAVVLGEELGPGFAGEVADVIQRKEQQSLYDSVVSSQFDADRLDYMQRDRLMTGVQSSGIDVTWLLANLEIGSVQTGTDNETSGKIETLVLGPKAFYAAENYVLSLFQLYPNIYFHKTTRAAEKCFSCLMLHLIRLVRMGQGGKTGLPPNHPIRRFATEPSTLGNALALDDAVFWGALPLLADAKDPLICNCAVQLQERKLPKCIDIRRYVEGQRPMKQGMGVDDRRVREAEWRKTCKEILRQVGGLAKTRKPDQPQILMDVGQRSPYRKFQDSKTPLNQILIKLGSRYEDMAHLSQVVASAETFETCRVYHVEGDTKGKTVIENIMGTSGKGAE